MTVTTSNHPARVDWSLREDLPRLNIRNITASIYYRVRDSMVIKLSGWLHENRVDLSMVYPYSKNCPMQPISRRKIFDLCPELPVERIDCRDA